MSSTPDQAEQTPRADHESRVDRAGRYSRRTALYTSAFLIVLTLIAIVALVVENTRTVKVGWIFGYSHISLVWLVLFSAILGWLLGLATSFVLRRRSRRPH